MLAPVKSPQGLLVVFTVICTIGISSFAQSHGQKKPVIALPPKKIRSFPRSLPKKVRKVEAAKNLKIASIAIKGHKKIEEDAIREKLTSKVGQVYDPELIRKDIEALAKTGYFDDVQVDLEETPDHQAALTYIVVEKPSVAEIVYHGNSELETDDFKDAVSVKPYEILNVGKIQSSIEKMQKLYEDKGFFLAKVGYHLEDITKGETVRLVFDIEENDKVKVKRISFIGNKALPASKLKARMATQEGGLFSFISGSGSYKQDAFDRDVQLLNYTYFNEGYVQVKVERPEVYVTPDKKGIYITIRIEEGEQYHVGNVDFTGDLIFSKDDLYNSIKIDKSKIVVYETLQNDLKSLTAKYGDLGYAFANVIPRTRIRDKDREMDITFDIDKGNKVYFGRINVVGNTKTRDKVVRRELKIREGELYNETRKRESQENVQRLGFFEEVNFNTSTPQGHPDQLNMDIVVKERNTGSIQLGAGYSSVQGVVFQGQINQTNFLGRGQNLGASVDLNQFANMYNLSFTDPYVFDTQWTAGLNVYQSFMNMFQSSYNQTKRGFTATIGHPLAEYLRGYLRYKLESTLLGFNDPDPKTQDRDLFPVEAASGITSSGMATIEFDKRNDRFAPSKGFYSNASIEYAGLGGTLKYTRGLATARIYHKVISEVIFRNNITYGVIASNLSAPDQTPPFNELFLLGGPNTLRGFPFGTVGKKKFSQKQYLINTTPPSNLTPDDAYRLAFMPFGGTQEIFDNLEFEFPLIPEAGIKGVVFYDIGNADDVLKPEDLRSDVGFGFRWFSPIGPLRFEWGFPTDRQKGENPVNFEFAIGSPF